MRRAAILSLILAATAAAGEPIATARNQPIAPVPATTDEPAMPVVVIAPPTNDPVEKPVTPIASETDSSRIPGSIRGSEEYLLWWIKPGSLPPLATRAFGSTPILGQPGTRDLFGDSIDLDERSGGRFVLGQAFNDARNTGLEFGYWFLGSRTSGFQAGGTSATGSPIFGRPIIDARTGRESFVPISSPGFQSGLLEVSWTTRAQGAEINLVSDMVSGHRWQIDGLAGYRFVNLHEGLNLTQYGGIVGPLSGNPLTALARADDFDCDNRYHGGQIGLRGDMRRGPIFAELTGKIAFGQMSQVVRVSGISGQYPHGTFQTIMTGGLLALPSNSGRVTRDAFAVVPEAIGRVGWASGEHGRFFVGYNFLFLSDVVRPGDQIDRTINRNQVPFATGIPPPGGPERPVLVLRSTDLWLQGLLIGFEGRW